MTSILLLIAALERYPEGKLVNRPSRVGYPLVLGASLLARWAPSYSEKPLYRACCHFGGQRSTVLTASSYHNRMSRDRMSRLPMPATDGSRCGQEHCAHGVSSLPTTERLAARAEAQDGASSGTVTAVTNRLSTSARRR